MLDPQAHALLKLMIDNGVAPVQTLGVNQARETYNARKSFTQPDAPAVARVLDHQVEPKSSRLHGLVAQASIAVREYWPTQPKDQVDDQGRLGALIYLHGGGWTIGNIETHDVLCRSLCEQSSCVVFSVDYAMGPEYPFPAAYFDVLDVFAWLQDRIAQSDLPIDPQRVALGGDSAGGNLTAAACLGLKGQALVPCYQLLIYPATNMLCDAPSHHKFGKGYMLTSEAIAWFRSNYVQDPALYTDWRASPLLASSHADLPPALVLIAGYDPLSDEGLMYADALSSSGVKTQVINFERQIHGFITMGRLLDEANTAVSVCALALAKALKPQGPSR
jgi:acetyl esterase